MKYPYSLLHSVVTLTLKTTLTSSSTHSVITLSLTLSSLTHSLLHPHSHQTTTDVHSSLSHSLLTNSTPSLTHTLHFTDSSTPVLTHSLTHSLTRLTHSLTQRTPHSLTHSLPTTHSLTPLPSLTLTHSLTHLLTHSLTHSLTLTLTPHPPPHPHPHPHPHSLTLSPLAPRAHPQLLTEFASSAPRATLSQRGRIVQLAPARARLGTASASAASSPASTARERETNGRSSTSRCNNRAAGRLGGPRRLDGPSAHREEPWSGAPPTRGERLHQHRPVTRPLAEAMCSPLREVERVARQRRPRCRRHARGVLRDPGGLSSARSLSLCGRCSRHSVVTLGSLLRGVPPSVL